MAGPSDRQLVCRQNASSCEDRYNRILPAIGVREILVTAIGGLMVRVLLVHPIAIVIAQFKAKRME